MESAAKRACPYTQSKIVAALKAHSYALTAYVKYSDSVYNMQVTTMNSSPWSNIVYPVEGEFS